MTPKTQQMMRLLKGTTHIKNGQFTKGTTLCMMQKKKRMRCVNTFKKYKCVNLGWLEMSKNYRTFIEEILDASKNCEGSGVPSTIESVINSYQDYFSTTRVPVAIAKWIEELYELLDNCDGSELERELVSLKSPL